MKEITARGKILINDKGLQYLNIDNPTWLAGELSRFDPDTPVVVTIKKWYRKRTLKQNNLYHAYISIMADYFGYSVDTMKSLVALKYLKQPLQDNEGNELVDITTGEILFELRGSKDLNTYEMVELCDNLREWSLSGWGIVLPIPGDNTELTFK